LGDFSPDKAGFLSRPGSKALTSRCSNLARNSFQQFGIRLAQGLHGCLESLQPGFFIQIKEMSAATCMVI
jgi:hypothetical protein